MVLGVDAPQFPFNTYYPAKLQSSPKYVAGQALGDLANSIPGMLDYVQQEQKKKRMQQVLQGLMGQGQGQAPPTAGVGGMTQATPTPNVDPVLQTLAPILQADPDLVKSALPAIARGAYQANRPGKTGGSDYQWASLDEKRKEFQQRMKSQGDIQAFKQSTDQAILALRKAGLKTEADRLQTQQQEWIAQHFILSGLGFGPQESADTPTAGTEDDGWGDVQASP